MLPETVEASYETSILEGEQVCHNQNSELAATAFLRARSALTRTFTNVPTTKLSTLSILQQGQSSRTSPAETAKAMQCGFQSLKQLTAIEKISTQSKQTTYKTYTHLPN